ncbi:protein with a role in ER insertion of tail-anchored membrane protein [Schizosaccharomyces osmophilus]|uniref:Protein with a role in ER insertion of tail-anchored membrane protein n=1 Tax=Schizosaccharomyces osmophilus TaxID=2545709 RepID=A0AAF0AU52_9SCHI|nr:protein with a role in ER insertion of tail-anchored membrane protein [Schizosaccharomyces osmophilus]WBW71267.1 protein with a role in ER insertion of tail-anchored membrane protein [Schizosaccharomyces osmophilus]
MASVDYVTILENSVALENQFLQNPSFDVLLCQQCVKEQERALRFPSISYSDCYNLGEIIRKLYSQAKYTAPIVIDIVINGHQVFHAAFDGSSPDNDAFIKRKYATVNRFHMSSFRMGLNMSKDKTTMSQKYNVPDEEYGAFGGGFPITLTSGVQIGVICVSGLRQVQDHCIIVRAIVQLLQNGPAASK